MKSIPSISQKSYIHKLISNSSYLILVAIGSGLIFGYLWPQSFIVNVASAISMIFLNLLKLVSIPLISLSLLSTLTGMGNWTAIKNKTTIIFKYTLLTTIASATLALILYELINPNQNIIINSDSNNWQLPALSYKTLLHTFLPDNILQPFVEHNVMGVMFITLMLSIAILKLKEQQQTLLHNFFESLFQTIMIIIKWIVNAMPIAVWAFSVLFMAELKEGLQMQQLWRYLAVIVGANLIHGAVILPLFLKSKNISPAKAFKYFFKAISMAFFSKSSVAALPVAIECATNFGIKSNNARFCFPLCTTINMNACAAFILTTVLFVAQQNGSIFNVWQLIMWVFMATLAAIGNAGVPMGCFFLSGALLAAMGIPVTILGIILPFYAILDMLESAINIWSDAVVTIIFNEHQNKIEN